MKKLFLITILFFSYISIVSATDAILIYGWKNKDVFLGCINCSKNDDSSIWNKYGTYGSKYNDKSIWNKYWSYWDKYSDTSPYNKYASYPPVLVDYDGWFYGYLTVNTYNNPSNSSIAKYILLNYETIRDNISETYDLLFLNTITYTSSDYNTSSSMMCGKNSVPNSNNKCSCISGYEWEYPNLSSNYDCKPKVTADQACILSYWIYSVSSWWNNCTCVTWYQWSIDRKSCIKKEVVFCGKNSSPSESWKCSCNSGYIWEYPDISNNYDCTLKPAKLTPDKICQVSFWIFAISVGDNMCNCKSWYKWTVDKKSCEPEAIYNTSVKTAKKLVCKKWELIRNGKCVSVKTLK